MIDIEKERERTGYKGKPQQWQYGFDLAMSIAQKAEAEKCVWSEFAKGGLSTSCGYLFDKDMFQNSSNKGEHCIKCGKKIEEVSLESEDD